MFVDVLTRPREGADARLWRGTAAVGELQGLLGRFLGREGAREALTAYAARTGADISPGADAHANLVHHVETLLGGAVGLGVRAVHGRVGRGRGTTRRP